MDDSTTMTRIAASLDDLGFTYERRENDDVSDIRVRFTGKHGRYSVWFKLDHLSPDRANLCVRAYTPLSGDPSKPIPTVAVKPGRLAQLHVLLNLVNAQLRCGAFHLDPHDSDLTFLWAIPLEGEPTTDLIDLSLHMADAIDDMIANVRAIVIKGKSAWEVYAAHRERVNASYGDAGDADSAPVIDPAGLLDPDGWDTLDGWDDTEEGDAGDGEAPFRRAV
jgi:hypothetical protein